MSPRCAEERRACSRAARLAVLLLLCGDGLVLCRLDAALLRLPVVALLGVVLEPLLAVRLALVDASLSADHAARTR